MAELDPILLSRIQFAANITFHILFPSISIGLGWVLLFFKLRSNATRHPSWLAAYQFWVKIFALTFALGVVSGITMSFQFGTNWPGFMQKVGNIAGPLLAYEVLTAFFLEATFLGIMLFGFSRVSNRTHTLATILVATGTTMSAFWIIALNSWMHTPAGFEMRDGVAHVTDWLQILLNPSMPYRFIHMLLASGLTVAFLIAGVSAYRWLKGDNEQDVIKAIRVSLTLASVLMPLQIIVGDQLGLNTKEHQPTKVAAIEGLWKTERHAPLVLFALPNQQTQHNDYAISIDGLASLILTHDWNGEVKGLDSTDGPHPPVAAVFWSFRMMVGVGLIMLLLSWSGSFLSIRHKNGLCASNRCHRYFAYALVAMTFSGWIATVAGWFVTELGRQPWLVHGLLRTADAVSDVPPTMISTTLGMYLLVYIALILAYISTLFYLARNAARHSQKPTDDTPVATVPGTAASSEILKEDSK